MVRMDLRVVTISVERQEVMTRDNVPVTVDAVVYFRFVDPQPAVVKVVNFPQAPPLLPKSPGRVNPPGRPGATRPGSDPPCVTALPRASSFHRVAAPCAPPIARTADSMVG